MNFRLGALLQNSLEKEPEKTKESLRKFASSNKGLLAHDNTMTANLSVAMTMAHNSER
jgi:hypothetical protein